MAWSSEIISTLTAIIFIPVIIGWGVSLFIILLESAFKKRRPKWAYGALIASLAVSWIGALALIIFTFNELRTVHKILNVIFIIAAALLLVLIARLSKKTFPTKQNTKREVALFASFMAFTLFVCLSYLWLP